jgi:hypothetical protein
MSEARNDLQETEQEGSALTPEEHLESILFQFVNLYERWSEDRQVAARQGADIAKFVKAFSEQVAIFESIEEGVRDDMTTSIEAAAKNTGVSMGKMIGEAASKEVEPIVRKLREAVHDAEMSLSRYRSDSRLTKWTTIGITAFSSVAVSLIISWAIMLRLKPTMPLTNDQIATYQTGIFFESVWPKLSTKQRQSILDVSKTKNHEKQVE